MTPVTRMRLAPICVMRPTYALLLVVMACSTSSTSRDVVELTDRSTVCMVNDRDMGQPQLPVTAEGRTYYGCCAGCVTRLKSDPTVRTGSDPVTGRAVDKASAMVGRLPDGRVLYFESVSSLVRYRRGDGR